jgi:B9 domain-containing protein 2
MHLYMVAYFLGINPKLRNLQLVYDGTERYRLNTETMGKVHVGVNVLMKGFEQYGVAL